MSFFAFYYYWSLLGKGVRFYSDNTLKKTRFLFKFWSIHILIGFMNLLDFNDGQIIDENMRAMY